MLGCSSHPSAIDPVDVSPRASSRRAIDEYDGDGDGKLSDRELAAVPGIAKYKTLYDEDGDGLVSQAEIAARLRKWADLGLGFRQLIVRVTLNGRPLEGARVEFIPEEYLRPAVKPASGITDYGGAADLAMARQDMPADLADLPIAGVMGGTFKVRVTHPKIDLPARYNSETVLGEEIAFDTVRDRATVTLKTK